jgi:hypothetical protein
MEAGRYHPAPVKAIFRQLLSAIICADWSKSSTRRAAYVADVPTRLVR